MTSTVITLGTRGSPLALWQTNDIAERLRARWPALTVEIRIYGTSGDAHQEIPFTALADNAFTDQIEQALVHGDVDAAVHSYKDLPVVSPPSLIIAAVPVRGDVREALVSRNGQRLAELPSGAVIGTSSDRRSAILRALRPDLQIRPIRGPVDVRLQKVLDGEYDAVLFAAVGLERLGLAHHITEYFSTSIMPPAAGQGALAVQCRTDDARVRALIEAIDDRALHLAVRSEREAEHHTAQPTTSR
jgi:hydroxymethylbilane synthase